MVFRILKIFLVTIIFVNFSTLGNAKDAHSSFADLAEKLIKIIETKNIFKNLNTISFHIPNYNKANYCKN